MDISNLDPSSLANITVNGLSTFALVFTAELGDKSQLVCMALAAKYRARLVLLGAISAFLLLNLMAVIVGASIAHLLPETLLKVCAALLLLFFAWKTWHDDEQDEQTDNSSLSYGVVASTFLLIVLAEMGDKTQLAVATISMTQSPLLVWVSASAALIVSCLFGVYAGKRWLARLDEQRLKLITTLLFVGFALLIFASLLF